ncbi:hypothetical protein IC757_13100 [Wenzhouxiangella sp. AB-CW3]|uniref:hypothetical protein n=1 Tax=Wenzhouxiangella sp. AB-CW3 TaxID=2771012 RepID=UPI00168A8055|nr:hypothetical protein [Wenzhouxiangella sp. AB-CW3]QOC21957.1 hypothetical protein IC757_13100 [Wenzhouxiangella sp. AB-CW3]
MNNHDSEDKASWPYKTLLFLGFYGMGESAGRRLVWQTHTALGVLIVSVIMIRAEPDIVIPRFVWIVAVPLSVMATAWAHAHYLKGLDELRQLIQLKAMAVAYACAMTLWSIVVVIWAAFDTVPLDALVLLIVLAEIGRGIALAWFARQYD